MTSCGRPELLAMIGSTGGSQLQLLARSSVRTFAMATGQRLQRDGDAGTLQAIGGQQVVARLRVEVAGDPSVRNRVGELALPRSAVIRIGRH